MFLFPLKILLIFICIYFIISIINYYRVSTDNNEFSIKNNYYQFYKGDCGIFENSDCKLGRHFTNKNLDIFKSDLHNNYYQKHPDLLPRCFLINKLYGNSCFIYFGKLIFPNKGAAINSTIIVNIKSSQLLDSGTKTNLYSRKYIRDLGLESDDAGHILGKRLGGYGNLTSKINTHKYDKIDPRLNLIPQTPSINRGIYRKYEETIYNCIKDYDTQAILEWYIIYENGELNNRPIKIIYSADFKKGCKSMKQEFYNSIEEIEGDVGE